jgi:tetratricopeptide (TPR) repeat protein
MYAEQQGITFYNQGLAFDRSRQYGAAVSCFRDAAESFRLVDRLDLEGDSRHNLAEDLHLIGRHAEAGDQFKLAFMIWQRLGRTSDAGQEVQNAGVENYETMNYGDALDCFGAAAALFRSIGDQEELTKSLRDIEACKQHMQAL